MAELEWTSQNSKLIEDIFNETFDWLKAYQKSEGFNYRLNLHNANTNSNWKSLLNYTWEAVPEIQEKARPINLNIDLDFRRYANGSRSKIGKPTAYYPIDYLITYSPGEFLEHPFNKTTPKNVLAHEWGHVGDMYMGDDTRPFEYTVYSETYPELESTSSEYSDKAREKYADMISDRKEMQEAGIYDSFSTEEFTEEHLNKYLDYLLENAKQSRLYKTVGKDNYIKIMQNVAQNNYQNNQNSYYAKRGTKLISKKRYIK